jgi:hypothetical protein
MTPIELSVSDATIWSVTLESSITILEVPFTLIYFVYHIGITYDDRQLMICGLYYKHMMIVNYASSVINNIEALLTDDARVVIYNCHVFIVQATEYVYNTDHCGLDIKLFTAVRIYIVE